MLDLDFTAEQDMLRDALRSLLADTCGLSRVRELEDDPAGFDPDLWRQLAALDLIGLMLPEAHGGSGMGLVEGVVVYEELGRALAPTPHFVSAVLTGGLLARAASPALQETWLPALGRGERIVSVAWLEPGGSFAPAGVTLTARPGDGAAGPEGGAVLDGTKWHVPFASAADALVVLARDPGSGAADPGSGIEIHLVATDAPGVSMTQQLTVAGDTQYALRFDGVAVDAGDRIAAAPRAWAAWHDTMLDGAILQAAWAVGAAHHALELTVQYAKDRHQFGKPLGAFQALAHDLANARTDLDGATALVHEAAWARDAGRDVARLAPMAKAFAGRTFRDITATAQQIFGGVGFTVEYDVQLFFRRAKALQLSWWDDRHCHDLIAATVLDSPDLAL